MIQQSFRQARFFSTKSLLNRLSGEDGSSIIEIAFMLPILALLLAGAVDFGRAWYVNLEVASAAEAGALYGIQNPTDTVGMKAAAALDAPDLSNLQAAAISGNECSDGTSAVSFSASTPNCAVNSVQFVEVDTSAVYKPILNFPGVTSSYTLTGKSRMRSSGQ
jgi:Flp pilus assembly protein TadG